MLLCFSNFNNACTTAICHLYDRKVSTLHHLYDRKVNNNNNNRPIVICKAHKVSSNAESEAPAVARWAALVGYAKRTVLRRCLKVSAVGESLVQARGKSFQTVGAR